MTFDNKTFGWDIKQKLYAQKVSRSKMKPIIGISAETIDLLTKKEKHYPNMQTFLIIIEWLGEDPKKYFI